MSDEDMLCPHIVWTTPSQKFAPITLPFLAPAKNVNIRQLEKKAKKMLPLGLEPTTSCMEAYCLINSATTETYRLVLYYI